MIREILFIRPKLSPADAAKFDADMRRRFDRLARRFGRGIGTAIMGGGVIGTITSLVARFVNPMKELHEAIDKSLAKGDDLVTYAKHFNTTEGNLARLQAFGSASGLDAEGVRMLLGKFQGAVADAAADPTKPSAVRAYVGDVDTAESFFEFIRGLQKMPALQRTLAQQEVFGEKQTLKSAEFLGADFDDLARKIDFDTELASFAAKKLEKAEAALQIARANMESDDLINKASLIGRKTIDGRIEKERLLLAQENEKLAKATGKDGYQQMEIENIKLMNEALKAFSSFMPLIVPMLTGMTKLLQLGNTDIRDIKGSRANRGMTGEGEN